MPFRRAPTPADAIAAFAAAVRGQHTALFLVFGSEDPQTGASWCPDCVTADPVLRAALHRQRPDLVVHECPVGERSAWKNQPEHPLRTHPGFRIARIPTLIFLDRGIERGRLVEGDCAVADRVAAFLA